MRFRMPYLQPSFSPPTQTHFPRLFWGSLEISSLGLITFSLRTLVVTCFSSSAALTSYHKHTGLKQHKGIPHGPCRSQVHCGSHRTEVKVLAGPHCLPEARGRTPFKSKQLSKSVPGGCNGMGPVSLLAVGRGLPAFLGSRLPSSFKASNSKLGQNSSSGCRSAPLWPPLCAHFCHHLLCLLSLPPLLRAHQITLHPPG